MKRWKVTIIETLLYADDIQDTEFRRKMVQVF